MPLDEELLGLLRCPAEDHGELRVDGDRLECLSCGRRYPVRDDIPVMLLDQAEEPRSEGTG
ncbi:MAG: Trm112 family protein [Chloroflexi bacterium]|nr:Trm112 family protein [Chloroflexota bacterium]